MISFEDCVGLCGLTEAEVAAIAEHEHVPEVAAAILGQYLLHQQHGPEQISQMIVDDLRCALRNANAKHAAELLSALRQLLSDHPEAGLVDSKDLEKAAEAKKIAMMGLVAARTY
jgi:hypothetical protein